MRRCLAMASALVLGGLTASAHHPFSATYDRARPATLTGTIAAVEWRNPHVIVAIDVGSERYAIEGLPPNTLRRQGWTDDMLRPGARISMAGWHARDAALKAFYGYEVTFADGSKRQFGNPPDGADRWECATDDCPAATWIPTFVQRQ